MGGTETQATATQATSKKKADLRNEIMEEYLETEFKQVWEQVFWAFGFTRFRATSLLCSLSGYCHILSAPL